MLFSFYYSPLGTTFHPIYIYNIIQSIYNDTVLPQHYCYYIKHFLQPVSLCHASMIDHEEVDLEVVCAGSGDGVVFCSYELNHLHTAALTLLGGWHGALQHNNIN